MAGRTRPMPQLFNLKEVADILRVSKQTVYNHIWAGKLNATKCGKEYRVTREDLDDYIRHGHN